MCCEPREAVLYPGTVAGADPRIGDGDGDTKDAAMKHLIAAHKDAVTVCSVGDGVWLCRL